MEILSALGINWQLLIAQAINFAIILFVLARFVYRPILKVIDDRREATRKAMENVEVMQKEAREMEATRMEKLKKIDEEAGALMEAAKKDAEAQRKQLLEAAHAEADQVLAKGRKQLEQERAAVFQDAQETLSKVIMTMTQKILEREFSKDDQKRIVQNLQKELPSLLP
jgi:F-type H+-transporting ATPase subunit b